MRFLDRFLKKRRTGPAAPPAKIKTDRTSADKADVPADKKTNAPVTRGPLAKEQAGNSHRVLLRPLFTEKSDLLKSVGKYCFIVAPDANKNEVAAAIRDLYGVKPQAVHIIVAKGKSVRFGRTSGKEKDEKKAVVTLEPGKSLTVVEGI